nr:MAG TPA: hypothetical protein [Caudoviricetes sp.]
MTITKKGDILKTVKEEQHKPPAGRIRRKA